MTGCLKYLPYRGEHVRYAPLSPTLFALEPLAILIWDSLKVHGLRVGCLEEKLSLYVDAALLYLNNAGPFLFSALRIFHRFGSFSGIKMNWSKSILFSIDDQATALGSFTPLFWVEEFRYLGIQVTRKPTEFFRPKHPTSTYLT